MSTCPKLVAPLGGLLALLAGCAVHLGRPPEAMTGWTVPVTLSVPFAEPGLADGLRLALGRAGVALGMPSGSESGPSVVVSRAEVTPLAVGADQDLWRVTLELRVESAGRSTSSFVGSAVYTSSRIDSLSASAARAEAFQQAADDAARDVATWLAYQRGR